MKERKKVTIDIKTSLREQSARQQATETEVEGLPRKQKEKVLSTLERTRKIKEEPIKGKGLEQEYEKDKFELVVKDLEIITEMRVQERVNKPMQFMALEVARLETEKHDQQKKEEERDLN